MSKKIKNALLSQRYLQSVTAVVVILAVVIVGVNLLVSSHAQSPYSSLNTDGGTLTGDASIVNDQTASDGRAVQFGCYPAGQCVPIGDQPGWHQVFYDNFADENAPLGSFSNCSSTTHICSGLPTTCTTSSGVCPSLPNTGPQSKWGDYPDGDLDVTPPTWLDPHQQCIYQPSQTMSIADGIMNMYIHTGLVDGKSICMTAVPYPILPNSTDGDDGQLYGMYSVRMRADPVSGSSLSGFTSAFLLWPDSEIWPQDGEIDFPNRDLSGSPLPADLIYQGAFQTAQNYYQYLTSDTQPYSQADWHTYTIQWTPTYVNFLIDGQSVGEYDSQTPDYSCANIPSTPMHFVLQVEGDYGQLSQPPPSGSGNLQIAWASIWSYDPSTPASCTQ